MPIDTKPSHNEEEFFAKQDAELMRMRRAALDEERRTAERRSHYMKCPKCGCDLEERQFHKVKVDVCPECNGTWLDGGELESLSFVKQSELTRFIGALFGLNK